LTKLIRRWYIGGRVFFPSAAVTPGSVAATLFPQSAKGNLMGWVGLV